MTIIWINVIIQSDSCQSSHDAAALPIARRKKSALPQKWTPLQTDGFGVP